MIEGLYTAASGMRAQQDHLDSLSGDIANVSTNGYKHQRVDFRDLLYTAAAHGAGRGVELGSGAAMTTVGRSSQQGAIQETGNPLDVAISGDGYIAVRLPDGRTALTRDGHLRLDDRSRLVTASGILLSGVEELPAGTQASDVSIGPDGTVRVGEQAYGRIRLQTVPAPGALTSIDDNMFVVSDLSGALIAAPSDTELVNGALEASTVDLGRAMSDLIVAQRAYQMASKAIQMQDQILEIANGVKR